jgi:cell division protein ZapA (FtsZ GTPase activity inhibitor)
MSVQIVNIDLLGSSFSVQTDESPDYMQALLGRLRERIESMRSTTRVADPLKLSILLNITLLDELLRFKPESRENAAPKPADDELSNLADKLIAELDKSLCENGD